MQEAAEGSTATNATAGESVRVVLRCRPLSQQEMDVGRRSVVISNEVARQVTLRAARPGDVESRDFSFDSIFSPAATQRQIFEDTARPIIDSVIQGYNGTIFAYGQTGAGKTFTMEGGPSDDAAGITPRTFATIFDAIASSNHCQFLFRVSFLEIYNEEIRDLLSKSPGSPLALREAGTERFVKDLSSVVVKSASEVLRILEVGRRNRATAATAMNKDSSRSHSLFIITVESSQGSGGANGGDTVQFRVGKLNLVDLAGSERVGKSQASGDRLKEATKINLSLSALGNVIGALADGGAGHVPYRDSKLTRLLQDSLGGNSKTVMIANIGPADYNYDETLSTLRFAGRAKCVRNKPVINEDPKDAMLRQYQQEILSLRNELARCGDCRDTGSAVSHKVAAGQIAQSELQRLQAEAAQRQVQLATLEASLGQHSQTVENLQRQRDEEQCRREDLEARLEKLQSRLLSGSGLQPNAKAAIRSKAEDLKRSAEAIKAAMRARSDAAQAAAAAEVSDLKEQAEASNSELQKVWRKHEATQRELRELEEAWAAERKELQEQKAELQRQLGLKDLVIQALVPQQELDRIMRQASWNLRVGRWVLKQQEAVSLDFGDLDDDHVLVGSPRGVLDQHGGSNGGSILAKPPWETQSASSVSSWQDMKPGRDSSAASEVASSRASSAARLEVPPWEQPGSAAASPGSSPTKSRLGARF